jgi:hypothetical protein
MKATPNTLIATRTGPVPRRGAPAGRARQRGNALVWFMLAAVLGGVGIVAGVDMYQSGERSATVQQVANEVTAIIGDAQATFGQYGYAGLTTPIAVGAGVIPRSRATLGLTAGLNKFGGAITLVDNSASMNQTASLSYAGVPAELCMQIVTSTERMARSVQVSGTVVKAVNGTLSAATLNTTCNAGTVANISWIIGRV